MRVKVRGIISLDESLFQSCVELPAIKILDEKEIKNISKLIKKYKINCDRPKWKPLIKNQNLFVISPNYKSFDKSTKEIISQKYEIVYTECHFGYENFTAAEILGWFLNSNLKVILEHLLCP